ncbi:MAG: Hpt domain-containing protein, partial [Treponema sp.]|nr:Hpt domain-containing protein [Treponema sp.]
MSDYLDPNNEELLKDFFAEAEQQVEQLESNILVIENDPTNHEAIDEIFRAAHTLKGGSATVEMMELSHFTHTVEDVLDEIRSDRLKVDEDVVDLLLNSIDVIKAMLEARQNGSVYEENIDDIVNKLHNYIPNKEDKKKKPAAAPAPKPAPVQAAPVAAPVQSAPASSGGIVLPELTEADFSELKQTCEGNQKLWCVAVKFDENNPMNTVGGIQVFAALKSVGNVLKTVPDFDALYEDQFFETVFYYLASDAEGSQIEDVAFLSDVTLITDAHELKDYTSGTSADSSVAAAKPSAAAPVQTQVAASTSTTMNSSQEALLADILNDNVLKPESKPAASSSEPVAPVKTEEKKEEKKVEPKKEVQNHSQQGSILRVDSRRIDNLMNLVSEAVINKASFNQLSMQTAAELTKFQSLETEFKEKLHNLFDKLPEFIEQAKGGVPTAEIRKSIVSEYGDLAAIFDSYESETKNISGKFRSYTQNLGTIASDLQEGVMKIRMVPINQIFS